MPHPLVTFLLPASPSAHVSVVPYPTVYKRSAKKRPRGKEHEASAACRDGHCSLSGACVHWMQFASTAMHTDMPMMVHHYGLLMREGER